MARAASHGRKGDRITVEADPTQAPQAVYDLIETINIGLPLGLYSVTQVELAVTMAAAVGQFAKTHTLRITHPISCSLKFDELDRPRCTASPPARVLSFHRCAATSVIAPRWGIWSTGSRLAGDSVASDATDDHLVALPRAGNLTPADMARLVIAHHRARKLV